MNSIKKITYILLIGFVVIAGFGILKYKKISKENIKEPYKTETITPKEESMKLSSSAFINNGKIPDKYTCHGDDLSPPLVISQTPLGVKSFCLIVGDPDAPAGDWFHWLVWDIPQDTTEIPEGSAPQGSTEGVNDFGVKGYKGPCPPRGQHRYFFNLYALDTILGPVGEVTKESLLESMKGHILAQAELVGVSGEF